MARQRDEKGRFVGAEDGAPEGEERSERPRAARLPRKNEVPPHPKDPAREATVTPGKNGRPQLRLRKREGWTKQRRKIFLDHLAATCNVTASATAAGLYWAGAYAWRRKDPEFAAQWQAALETGYARLEAMLVDRAAVGSGAPGDAEGVDAAGAPPPDPSQMDVALALHLLRIHRGPLRGRPLGTGKKIQRANKKETVQAVLKLLRVLRRRLAAEGGR
jgi:hypothetical protein